MFSSLWHLKTHSERIYFSSPDLTECLSAAAAGVGVRPKENLGRNILVDSHIRKNEKKLNCCSFLVFVKRAKKVESSLTD